MDSVASAKPEDTRSQQPADLKQEEPAALSDPDTAGLPDDSDDAQNGRGAPANAAACALKVLVSNNVAGSLIGKAGSAINDIQAETGARIKLSQANEFFPATQFRVVLITGSPEAVKHANSIVWEKITNDMDSIARRPQGTDPASITGRITIPHNAAGLLLGRAGVTLRQISEETRTKIQLSNKEDCHITQERVVSITGASDACVRCVEIIIDKLLDDPKVGKYTNLTTSYSRAVPAQYAYAPAPQPVFTHPNAPQHAIAMMAPGMPAAGPGGMPPMGPMARAETLSTVHTIRMAVHDAYMGLILGRNGSTLTDIQTTSRARIVVSARNEYVPGTTNRTVTITGSPMAAETARFLIMQRLSQIPGAPTSSPPSVGPAMEMNGDQHHHPHHPHHHPRGL